MVEEEKNHTVSKRSSAYMFGQIMARLDEGDKVISNLAEKVDDVSKAVYGLPCLVHEEKLSGLEEWQEKYNGRVEKKSEIQLKFKHGLIVSAIAMGISAAMTFFLVWIIGGG